MTATDELCRLLNERGVEWDELVGHPVVVGTEWHDSDGYPCTALEHAYDVPDGLLSVQANLTPEQAIEATLGSDLQAENEQLRELVRDMLRWMPCPKPCSRCERYKYPEGCEFEIRRRELGMEK